MLFRDFIFIHPNEIEYNIVILTAIKIYQRAKNRYITGSD